MSYRGQINKVGPSESTTIFNRKYSGALADLADSYLKRKSPSQSLVSTFQGANMDIRLAKAISPEERSLFEQFKSPVNPIVKMLSVDFDSVPKERVSKDGRGDNVANNSSILVGPKQDSIKVKSQRINPVSPNQTDSQNLEKNQGVFHFRSKSLGFHTVEPRSLDGSKQPWIPTKLFNETVQFKKKNYNKFLRISRRSKIPSQQIPK